MERIGLILNNGNDGKKPHPFDQRLNQTLRNQIRQWTTELFGEVELEDVGPPPTGDPDTALEPGKSPQPENAEFKFCIYDSDHFLPLSVIREKWNLKNVPIIALSHNATNFHPQHPGLSTANDILHVPLDRLLFLQKIELLVAGDQAVTPTFLFQTKIEDPRITFELGKQVHITHISETGCTVISPRPIAVGVEGTLSCSLLGEQEGLGRQVEVRVQSSVPYFESNVANASGRPLDQRPPEYEVRLRFFGLKQIQLKFLRTWLARNIPGGLPEIKRSDAAPEHRMRVALITPRIDTQSMLRSSLEQLTQIEVTVFSGFKRFTAELLANLSDKKSTAGTIAAPNSFLLHHANFVGPKRPEELIPLLPRQLVKVRLRFDDLFVESIEPKLSNDGSLLGAKLESWERDASQLTKGFNLSDRETFDELLAWVASGSGTEWKNHIAEFVGFFTASASAQGTIKCRMKLIAPREGIKSPVIEISIENFEASATETSSKVHQYEVVLIDASLIQGPSLPEFEARERIVSLSRACETYSLRNAFGNPTPIVVFNALETLSAKVFRGTKVRQMIYDFSDRRYHAELFINLSRPELWSSPGLAVQGLQTDVTAALFRPTTLVAISEAGFSILDKIPIKPGASLQIVSSLWPDIKSPVWSRVRRTSEAPEGLFQEDFIFLGVDDEIQKSIRNFTRSDYVQKKKSE
ncbi:MAG: hypothetical protein J0L82_18590 [Deltaproteobacteria bacterium]|nr:hypothetical protein [Deltaproteobacteria bacterium]